MADDITRSDEFHTHTHTHTLRGDVLFHKMESCKINSNSYERVPGPAMASSWNLISKCCLMVLLLEHCVVKPITAPHEPL